MNDVFILFLLLLVLFFYFMCTVCLVRSWIFQSRLVSIVTVSKALPLIYGNSNRFLFRRFSQARTPKSSFSLVHTPFVTQSFFDLCSILPTISIELKIAIELCCFRYFIDLVHSNVVNFRVPHGNVLFIYFFSFTIYFSNSIQFSTRILFQLFDSMIVYYLFDRRSKKKRAVKESDFD